MSWQEKSPFRGLEFDKMSAQYSELQEDNADLFSHLGAGLESLEKE